MKNLSTTNELCRLLSDPTRVRLLWALCDEELSVAELTELTGLAQSRVSSHLGKLREAGLVQVRRRGTSSLYGADEDAMPEAPREFWRSIRVTLRDPLLQDDRAQVQRLVRLRSSQETWADTVAGQMERHYSPGRTWEGMARGLVGLIRAESLLDLASGDGAIAELIAPSARAVTCLDKSQAVIDAGRTRLAHLPNVRFVVGDMHDLPFEDAAYDQVLLMNALPYAFDLQKLLNEVARVTRPEGRVIIVTLLQHPHEQVVGAFNHVNLGFTADELREGLCKAGFEVPFCEITHREKRAPHFRVLTAYADRNAAEV